MQAGGVAAYGRRVIAALAFWLAAVLFVIDVSLLSGWLSAPPAAAASPAPTVPTESTEVESAIPTRPPSPAGMLEVALDGGATITFPQPPIQSQQVVEIAGDEAVLVMHAATTADETTYNVGVIEYPPAVDVGDPAVNLIGSVSGAAGSSNARIVSQQVLAYDGAPAVEFTLETAGTTVLARNVLVGRRLYANSVSFVAGANPSDAEDFLDSLVLPD